MIRFSCPKCGKKFTVKESHVGAKGNCTGCGQRFQVPAPPNKTVLGRLKDKPEPPRPSEPVPPPLRARDDRHDNPSSDAWDRRPVHDDSQPVHRSVRRDEDRYDDYEEDRPESRGYEPRRGSVPKPSQVQTAGILMLVGGIVSVLMSGVVVFLDVIVTLGVCCLYPGYVYALVSGILAIIRGSMLLGENAHRGTPGRFAAILLIINVVNFDLVSMGLGIAALALLNGPEVDRYFGRSERRDEW